MVFGLGLVATRMKLYVKKKVLGGFIITISILISLGVYAYISHRALLSASREVSHLNHREAELSRRIWHADVAFISLLGTTVLILAAVFGILQVHLAGRSRAEENAGQLHRELEGFTYSVSHDLRAPLRSIHGYSQILQDEYGEKLDANGRRIVDTIMKNARKVGRLIDDLLDFSRVGRSTLTLER
ncbi:histidine kinase dimerization/phospho-acceptor domain-containing protein [Parachryseolinea silvisoli]|uniref:histidine kinase dimerization/phospho-acceptor domain-containing protein n=1 Tax=Parachryseolinea silvisoli TaxID=2873601 RepID=UPI002265858B|nr:histidine kinase dimerization/phospho-acceptor domain-containing protein [Parachryseolinea silvisoli]